MKEEKTKYRLDIDANGMTRYYTSLAVAKREAKRQAKRIAEIYGDDVTADVCQVTFEVRPDGELGKKLVDKLVHSYTYEP